MGNSRARLVSAQIITNGAMTGTSTINSSEVDVSNSDVAAIQLEWGGSPNGTFAVQAAVQVLQPTGATPPAAASWQTIVTPTAPGGTSGSHIINIADMGFSKLRVTYTNSSGTGTLNGYITIKGS